MAQFDRPTQGQELSSTATEEQSGRRLREPAAARAEPDFSSMIMSAVMRERAQELSDRVAAAPEEDRQAVKQAARRLYEEAAGLRERTPEDVERAWQGLPRDTRQQMIADRREGLADDVARVERGDFSSMIKSELMRERADALAKHLPPEEDDPLMLPRGEGREERAAQGLYEEAAVLQGTTPEYVRREWWALPRDARQQLIGEARERLAEDVAKVERGDRREPETPVIIPGQFVPLIGAELMKERAHAIPTQAAAAGEDREGLERGAQRLLKAATEREDDTSVGAARAWEALPRDTREAMINAMRRSYAGDVARIEAGLETEGPFATFPRRTTDLGRERERSITELVERVDALDARVKRGQVEVERAPVSPQVPSAVEAAHGAAHSLEAQTGRRAADQADLARQLRGESRDVRNAAEDLGRAPAATQATAAAPHGRVSGEEATAPNAGARAAALPSNAAAGPQQPAWTGTITEAIRRAQELPGVTAFVSADWERHSRPRVEQADDLVKNIDRVRDLIAPELANMRVYTVTPEGRVHNTVTGRDEYVALSPEVVKARPELERAVEKAHPAPPGRVQELAKAAPSITPDLN